MTFFKIIQNGNVIGVGSSFLKWNMKYHQMFVSDVDHGQFVSSEIDGKFYRDGWMKPYPDEASGFIEASVISISREEYTDLRDLLNNGETVSEEEIVPEIEIHHEAEIESEEAVEEKMTLAEMRKMILQQQKLIEELLKDK